MRDPKRIDDFLNRLGECWKKVPDWRFGQLISNVKDFAYDDWPQDIFFIEDEQFIYYVEKFFKEGDE